MGSKKNVFSEEMVVGFDPGRKEKSLSSLQCGFCGAVSGVVTRLVVQPLDVLKIRFQLQIEPTSKVLLHLNEQEFFSYLLLTNTVQVFWASITDFLNLSLNCLHKLYNIKVFLFLYTFFLGLTY